MRVRLAVFFYIPNGLPVNCFKNNGNVKITNHETYFLLFQVNPKEKTFTIRYVLFQLDLENCNRCRAIIRMKKNIILRHPNNNGTSTSPNSLGGQASGPRLSCLESLILNSFRTDRTNSHIHSYFR